MNNTNSVINDCETILAAMQIPHQKSVYCVGSFEKGKITIHSQQTRALNLAYALIVKELCTTDFKEHCLHLKKTNKSVAIIGAGFSGMTIAYALSNITQVSVTVYEQFQGTFDLQRKSDRVIHPNVFDWPAPGCTEEQTSLPFFNWKMSEVKDVVNIFSKHFDLRKKNYTANLKKYSHVKITGIESTDDYVTILQGGERIPAVFDIVIVCAGFGKEENHEQSYWLKDNDDRNATQKKTKHLILGNGDGGIIDSIRTSLYDFRYDDFINKFVNDNLIRDLGVMLVNEETIIRALPLSAEEKAELLYAFYKIETGKSSIEKHIKSILKDHEKSDIREVHLVGKSGAPFSFYANPLNKLLITIFCEPGNGYITYHSSIDEFKKYLIPLVNQKNKILRAIAGQIRNLRLSITIARYKRLIRTGPQPVIYDLFKKFNDTDINSKIKQLSLLDIGNKQYWLSVPDFFNEDGFNIDDENIYLHKSQNRGDYPYSKDTVIL